MCCDAACKVSPRGERRRGDENEKRGRGSFFKNRQKDSRPLFILDWERKLRLVATTLPTNAYLLTGEAKYRRWIVEYMDAWLARMKENGGIIPSFVDLDGRIGGPDGRWWGNAYGWGFSPVNPVTGRREHRNRIPRALVGFSNALLVTGDSKYVDAWRAMIDAVNSHARYVDGRKQYPTMFGADGWYGWQDAPWSVGALEVWYLVSELGDRRTVVTLVNLNATASRTIVVQAGAHAEHQFESVEWNGQTRQLDAADFTVALAPGVGATLTLATRRYVNSPTVAFPWDRR